MVAQRDALRKQKQWTAADAIRDCLQDVGIVISDTAEGGKWEVDS
jgi:cysteinyl-tRNA synthetase